MVHGYFSVPAILDKSFGPPGEQPASMRGLTCSNVMDGEGTRKYGKDAGETPCFHTITNNTAVHCQCFQIPDLCTIFMLPFDLCLHTRLQCDILRKLTESINTKTKALFLVDYRYRLGPLVRQNQQNLQGLKIECQNLFAFYFKIVFPFC